MTDVSESAPTAEAASAFNRSMLLKPSAANAVEPISKNPRREIGPGQNLVADMGNSGGQGRWEIERSQPHWACPSGIRSLRYLNDSSTPSSSANLRASGTSPVGGGIKLKYR